VRSTRAAAREAAVPLDIYAFDHVVLNVADVEASARWYERVLGMTREDFVPGPGQPARVALRFGRQKLNLRPVTAPKDEWLTAAHERAGSDDVCFLTGAGPEDVVAHFRACGVTIVAGPVTRRGASGTLASVYCRDPDGNLIEVGSYAREARPS